MTQQPFHLAREPSRHQRVASQIKEIIQPPDVASVKEPLPDAQQLQLEEIDGAGHRLVTTALR